MVSESRVTWTTSVPILVFLGLSVLDLGLMYATNVRCQMRISLDAPYPRSGGIIMNTHTHSVLTANFPGEPGLTGHN